jgi:hypothetical protein
MVELTRTRVIGLSAAAICCYLVALALFVFALVLDRGHIRWLIGAGIAFLAIGMTASALIRLVILVSDARVRTIVWTNASRLSRILRVGGLVAHFGLAAVVWYLLFR